MAIQIAGLKIPVMKIPKDVSLSLTVFFYFLYQFLIFSGLKPLKCPEYTYQCPKSSKCIEFSQLCDRRDDCGDWEDEQLFCLDDRACATANCTYNCTMSPAGPQCYCAKGLKLVNNTCIGK